MPDVFRVFAYDINTNTQICELTPSGLTFDRRLNDAGACSFTIDLLDPRAAAQAAPLMPYIDSAPYALYVDRDGVIVWAGWAKTSTYQHTAHKLPVQAKEWPDYFTKRVIGAPYDQPTYPNGLDPAALLAKAVTDCQSTVLCGPGASVGIAVTGGSSSLPWTKPTYTMGQTLVSQVIADMVAAVTPGTGGLDYWIDAHWDAGGSPSVTLHIESPRAGRTAGSTGLTFDLLAAVDHTWPTDIGPAATTLYESGGGTGKVAPQVVQQVPGVAVGGLGQPPRLDKVIQHSNVLDAGQLSRIAYGEALEFSPPVATPTVTVRTADPANPLGSWIVGDDARLFAEPYERHPAGVDQFWRIVQHAVTVPDEGVPTVTLTFNPPPTY